MKQRHKKIFLPVVLVTCGVLLFLSFFLFPILKNEINLSTTHFKNETNISLRGKIVSCLELKNTTEESQPMDRIGFCSKDDYLLIVQGFKKHVIWLSGELDPSIFKNQLVVVKGVASNPTCESLAVSCTLPSVRVTKFSAIYNPN